MKEIWKKIEKKESLSPILFAKDKQRKVKTKGLGERSGCRAGG